MLSYWVGAAYGITPSHLLITNMGDVITGRAGLGSCFTSIAGRDRIAVICFPCMISYRLSLGTRLVSFIVLCFAVGHRAFGLEAGIRYSYRVSGMIAGKESSFAFLVLPSAPVVTGILLCIPVPVGLLLVSSDVSCLGYTHISSPSLPIIPIERSIYHSLTLNCALPQSSHSHHLIF